MTKEGSTIKKSNLLYRQLINFKNLNYVDGHFNIVIFVKFTSIKIMNKKYIHEFAIRHI